MAKPAFHIKICTERNHGMVDVQSLIWERTKKSALSSAYNKSLNKMFYAVVFLGFFGIVPLINRTHQIASDATNTFKLYAISDSFLCSVCLHVHTSIFFTLSLFRRITIQYLLLIYSPCLKSGDSIL